MLNAAIIGCGEMGKTHAECIAELEGVKNKAFCDLDQSRAEAFRNRFQADARLQG